MPDTMLLCCGSQPPPNGKEPAGTIAEGDRVVIMPCTTRLSTVLPRALGSIIKSFNIAP
eukprot:CAMPEP_0180666428 /NCGR_PEP_ID=MMETSP1037_2-20121125/61816_1 /TAXON_ID=632150 /ORGANISM="Azadinium spinosum, Strain 3D9" /LENGTH=58 /DNA_ID=CAMNT_0022694949 /DNA_START=77 /DNA_END=249 /DNA_ORIENTATION=-